MQSVLFTSFSVHKFSQFLFDFWLEKKVNESVFSELCEVIDPSLMCYQCFLKKPWLHMNILKTCFVYGAQVFQKSLHDKK